MPLPDGSIAATPGSGVLIATEDIGGVEYQAVMLADHTGHLLGSKPVYVFDLPSAVHVAVANTVFWDLFNADASLVVRVMSIKHKPDIITAVTGVAFSWLLERTTAVGTGGTAQTAWLPDTGQTALDADITMRLKPSGGATQSTDLVNYQIHSEETNAGTIVLAALGGLELVPEALRLPYGRGIRLGQNQGLRLVQVTNSAAGNSGFQVAFTVE